MRHQTTGIILSILITSAALLAEPVKLNECSKPQPIGGMQTLKENTRYPTLAVREHLESIVTLNFVVDRFGKVSDIAVIRSGGQLFDDSAIAAVLKTHWAPAQQGGAPVDVTYELPFEFRIK